MKKSNKIIAIVVLVISIIGIMISMGVVYSYATAVSNNTIGNIIIKNNTEKNSVAKDKVEENIVKEENLNKTKEKVENKEVINFTEKTENVYATTNVNIRKEANVNSEVIGVLHTGESIERTATGSNGWDKVKYNGNIAYINHAYLSLNKVAEPQTTTVQETTQTTKTAQQTINNSNPNNYLIKDVPFIAQNPKYPNGCEAASTTMLLNYYGMKISLTDFINNYLNMDKVYTKNGVRYGPNPEVCYAGDPASLHGGWGCFSTAIENAVNKLINQKYAGKYTVKKNTTNASLPELAKSKKPFAVWTTISYNVVQGQYTWKSYDGKTTYTYPKDLHVIVVIGQDDNFYYVNDPLKSSGCTKIAKATLEKSFDSMGRKAIIIDKM